MIRTYVCTMSIAVLLTLVSHTAERSSRNPIGERAFFQVVQDSSRTSRIIRGGQIVMQVLDSSALVEPSEFDVKLDYQFNVFMRGVQRGGGVLRVPDEMFKEEFLEALRASGHYETDAFKADHLGMASVRNIDGTTYEQCDRIRLYDIQGLETSSFEQILLSVAASYFARLGTELPESAMVENMVIFAHVKYGHPVLGAVRLDISGWVDGVNFQVGSDYIPGR